MNKFIITILQSRSFHHLYKTSNPAFCTSSLLFGIFGLVCSLMLLALNCLCSIHEYVLAYSPHIFLPTFLYYLGGSFVSLEHLLSCLESPISWFSFVKFPNFYTPWRTFLGLDLWKFDDFYLVCIRDSGYIYFGSDMFVSWKVFVLIFLSCCDTGPCV